MTALLPASHPFSLLRTLFKRARQHDGRAIRSSYLLERIEARQLADYRAALGFTLPGVPLTFLYLPVQRAHLATMLGPDFPFKLAGMVHVENELVEHATVAQDQPLLLHTEIEIEAVRANGAQYCRLKTIGEQDGRMVFESGSLYLAKRGKRSSERKERSSEYSPQGELLGSWQLAPDAGLAYARVSGDWNPIHLWPWSARLLGMRAPIIHGMHTLGMACALIEQRCGKQVKRIDVRFRAPVPLGTDVKLFGELEKNEFAAVCAGALAAAGRWA